MAKAKTIKVENYGDMLAQINNMELIDFYERGSYSGEYLAIMADDDRIFFFQDEYGSCSGCDWLEDETLEYGGVDKPYVVKYKAALDYCGGIEPKYIIPKDDKYMMKSVLTLLKRFLEPEE